MKRKERREKKKKKKKTILDQLQTGFGALRKKNASSFVLNFSFCCHFSLIRHLYPDIGNVKKKKTKRKKKLCCPEFMLWKHLVVQSLSLLSQKFFFVFVL